MTDSDSSIDPSLCINLRSRKVLKYETDPAKRCKIVGSWPRVRTTEMAEGGTKSGMYDAEGNVIKGQDEDEPLDASTTLLTAKQQQEDIQDAHSWRRDPNLSTAVKEALDRLEGNIAVQEMVKRGILHVKANGSSPNLSDVEGENEQTYGTPTAATARQSQISFSVDDSPVEKGARSKQRVEQTVRRRQRTRSLSADRDTGVPMITVPAELFHDNVRMQQGGRTISDTVVAPKPFTGQSSQDPESWFEYFERYANFWRLTPGERLELFGMMMHEGAADWMATLPEVAKRDYRRLAEEFKTNYYRSPELKWKEAGDLFNQVQGPNERVEDFVTRMRKAARRLNLTPDTLHYALINGLRGPIRLHVVTQGVTTLENSIRSAKIAEAAATTSTDAVTRLMLDAMKANAAASEKQAEEIRRLTARVATLAATKAEPDEHAMAVVTETTPRRPMPQGGSVSQLKPTPQNRQRLNYANHRPAGGPRSFRPGGQTEQQVTSQATPCGRCGNVHATGKCRADGAECRQCGRMNHFARVCRSAKARRD